MGALKALQRAPGTALEVSQDAETGWNAALQKALGNTVWTNGGCSNWYQGQDGRITNNWSGPSFTYRRAVHRFDAEHYLSTKPA